MVVVLLMCWAGAILYWRMSDHEPTTAELLLVLLAFPTVLMTAGWSLYRSISRRSSMPVTEPSGKPAQQPAVPSSPVLAILASSLRLPHGATAEELAEAVAQSKANTDLDPDLLDNDGFPVMTARSDQAVDETLQEEIAEWFSSVGLATLRLSDEQWRAVILGTGVVRELAAHATSLLIRPDLKPPMLKLIPVLPAEWLVEHRSAVSKWFEHTALQCGWPAAYLSMASLPDGLEEASPAVFDRLAQEMASSSIRLATIVVICASNIGQETVDRWAARTMLFTASQPQGKVPGEGAAGMLLTKPDAATAELEGSTLLHIETLPKNDGQAAVPLEDVTTKLLNKAALTAKDIAMVVADTGTQNKRVLELMQFATASMPQLDGATDVVRIGAISGSCGNVPFVASLALAHHYASVAKGPVLAISNEGPDFACASLIRIPAPSISIAPQEVVEALNNSA